MSNAASYTADFNRLVRQTIKLMLVVPLAILIFGALILAGQSTYENMRFNNATQQVVALVSIAHDAAGRQNDFAQAPGQDVLAALAHAGQILTFDDSVGAKLFNPWQGALHGFTMAPSILRIDMDVPTRDCRRLALYFADVADTLGLVGMETASGQAGWAAFYKAGDDETPPEPAAIEAACGAGPTARMALDFKLR